MSALVPAILPSSREDLQQKVGMLFGLTHAVQVDVVDGKFVSPASWPFLSPEQSADLSEPDSLPHLGQIQYEMDLMVADPAAFAGQLINAGANRIVLHAECSPMLPHIMDEIGHRYGHDKDFAPGLLSLGVAINLGTELSILEPLLPYAEYVQFMGIKDIGKQGEPFEKDVIRKIAEFRKVHPDVLIQVDGGVSLETIRPLLDIGVDRVVVGSALWKTPSPIESYQKLADVLREYNL